MTLQSQLAEFLSCKQQNVCLEELARSSVVSLSAGHRGSSLYAVASAQTSPPVGFRGRVRCDLLDSLERVGPLVGVGPQPPSLGRLPGGTAPRPALLVRCLGSRVGRQSPRPVCFGSLVDRGALPLDQPSRAVCHPSGSSALPPLSAGSCSGDVYRPHHAAVVYQKAGGTFLTALNLEVQLLLRRAESWELTLVPQFIMGPRTW